MKPHEYVVVMAIVWTLGIIISIGIYDAGMLAYHDCCDDYQGLLGCGCIPWGSTLAVVIIGILIAVTIPSALSKEQVRK